MTKFLLCKTLLMAVSLGKSFIECLGKIAVLIFEVTITEVCHVIFNHFTLLTWISHVMGDPEAYSEPSPASTLELFCQSS